MRRTCTYVCIHHGSWTSDLSTNRTLDSQLVPGDPCLLALDLNGGVVQWVVVVIYLDEDNISSNVNNFMTRLTRIMNIEIIISRLDIEGY